MSTRKVSGLLLALFGLYVLAGCASTAGTWNMKEIVPTDAAKQFRMQRLTLEKNGNFTAEALHGGEAVKYQGTYTYDKKTHRLKLDDTQGGTHEYIAKFDTMGGKMTVMNVGDTKEWTATYTRE